MDIFRKNKSLLWTIALLLLLNAASLGMLWYQNSLRPDPQREQPPRGPEAVARMIDRELNLSDDQMQKLDQLRREHFQEVSKEIVTSLKYFPFFGHGRAH